MTQPPKFTTLGCRLNAYESEAMKDLASTAGLQNAHIINTCAVTAEAVRKSRQEIRKIRRDNPDAQIIVTGCAAQIDPDSFAKMDEVSAVIGNTEKMQPDTWAKLNTGFIGDTEKIQVDDIMSVTETAGHLIDGFGTRSRAYVQVQNGCDHRCTFCIIPFGRGNNRSVPILAKAAPFSVRLGSLNSTLQGPIMDMEPYDAVLGLDWLRQNNPYIDWATSTLTIKRNGVNHQIYPDKIHWLMQEHVFLHITKSNKEQEDLGKINWSNCKNIKQLFRNFLIKMRRLLEEPNCHCANKASFTVYNQFN